MIIDCILDRKNGRPYDAREFYNDVRAYESVFKMRPDISIAMDYEDEKKVKRALCAYIDNEMYSKDIKKYINSVNWLQ